MRLRTVLHSDGSHLCKIFSNKKDIFPITEFIF